MLAVLFAVDFPLVSFVFGFGWAVPFFLGAVKDRPLFLERRTEEVAAVVARVDARVDLRLATESRAEVSVSAIMETPGVASSTSS